MYESTFSKLEAAGFTELFGGGTRLVLIRFSVIAVWMCRAMKHTVVLFLSGKAKPQNLKKRTTGKKIMPSAEIVI